MDSRVYDQLNYILALFDSQFPVGAFAFSWGLESFVSDKSDKLTLEKLVDAYIKEGPLHLELFSCKLSYEYSDCIECLKCVNDYVSAFKILPSVYEPSVKIGRNLIKASKEILNVEFPYNEVKDPHFSVVLGYVGATLNIKLDLLLFSFAHSNIKNLLSSLMRCIPLSPYEAWKTLLTSYKKLKDEINRILLYQDWDQIFVNTFLWDIHSFRQRFLETRLFEG
ncbi:Urease accessory protein UreF-like protein [Thermocrinis albus DSM 14484]|uniref:Urease accessory protein UreF-like protein n=1 Tax=Thermocrinis albus (strain DSM 14484 / JCM 11386 / HI 11/12) TaxID=638303 RepID=D3SQC0_THEAH|nr:urease accessory UreF family protein [Thermocrinis albus]ADC89357.1 Urease accessory protein UreF-like protein [Thermocrinis albus DSM 14484]